ncbi:MAG: hypothetical protein ABIP20_01080 [Chthoniobacteraceae bacterium]
MKPLLIPLAGVCMFATAAFAEPPNAQDSPPHLSGCEISNQPVERGPIAN